MFDLYQTRPLFLTLSGCWDSTSSQHQVRSNYLLRISTLLNDTIWDSCQNHFDNFWRFAPPLLVPKRLFMINRVQIKAQSTFTPFSEEIMSVIFDWYDNVGNSYFKKTMETWSIKQFVSSWASTSSTPSLRRTAFQSTYAFVIFFQVRKAILFN